MTTQFLSRVEREMKTSPYVDVGPGSYDKPGGITAAAPGFAPFASSARRMSTMRESHSPPPGNYNIAEDMTTKKGVTSGFKSHTKRFNETTIASEPGPGAYVPRSSLIKPVPVFARPSSRVEAIPSRSPSPPSIPTRSQSHGYEVTKDGAIRPQPPAIPGYSGKRNDSVGPGDYNPRIDNIKYPSAPRATFPTSPERTFLDKTLKKTGVAPGPGYYNTDIGGFSSNPAPAESDFILHLNHIKKKQLSSFASTVERGGKGGGLGGEGEVIFNPGPGTYTLPPSITKQTKPPALQCFTSSVPRFSDGGTGGGRGASAPPATGYKVVSSDFDKLRLNIMRAKKMRARSTWANQVGFGGQGERFHDVTEKGGGRDWTVPPPTTYTPKVSIADHVAKPNTRSGPFGSTAPRFREGTEGPTAGAGTLNPFQQKEKELNQEIVKYLGARDGAHQQHPASAPEGSSSLMSRSKPPPFTSAFAPTLDNRLRPVKTPPGPAPGAYNLTPQWTGAKGVVPMVPAVGAGKRRVDPHPGPGTYTLPPSVGGGVVRNRKNVMISTAPRGWRDGGAGAEVPGPGDYNLGKGLIKPSYNVLLADTRYQ